MVEYDRSAEMLSSAANSSGVTVTFPTETVRFFPGAAEVVVSVDVVTDVVSVVCVVVWSTIWIEPLPVVMPPEVPSERLQPLDAPASTSA